MLEAGVAATLAVVTGLAALANRLNGRFEAVHSRISSLDRRLDASELELVRSYVVKTEFDKAFAKMEDHMIRIENKLDQIALKNG